MSPIPRRTTARARLAILGFGAVLAIVAGAQAVRAEPPGDAAEPAVRLEAAYTADYLVNASGGLSRDDAYLDNLDLVASIDGEQAFGWSGATFTGSLLYNNRTTFSDRIVGDNQVLSNIDADGSLRLYELWYQQDLGFGQLKVGLVDLNSEFDVNETGALFMGSSHGVGPDFSQIGENGPSIFPITGLAALAKVDLGDRVKIRAGIFEGLPGSLDHPRRTVLRLDANDGYLLVGEVEFNPWQDSRVVLGARRLSARKAGAGPQAPGPREGQGGFYVLIEGPLARTGGGTLRGFARYGYADPATHDIGNYIGAGLVYSGPLLAGESSGEQLGLGIASIRNTDRFMLDQALLGTPADRWETSLELTYRVQATPWLALQPNVHYIINPGTNRALDNALVFGLRIEIGFERGF